MIATIYNNNGIKIAYQIFNEQQSELCPNISGYFVSNTHSF